MLGIARESKNPAPNSLARYIFNRKKNPTFKIRIKSKLQIK